jgi:hypothetical protein
VNGFFVILFGNVENCFYLYVMKKLTKIQLKKIAKMHAAGVLLATESTWAFAESNLSHSEIEFLDNEFEKMAIKFLDGEEPIYNANHIVDYVRSLK